MAASNNAQEIMDCVKWVLEHLYVNVDESMCGSDIHLYPIRDHENDKVELFLKLGIKYPKEALNIAAIFGNLEAAKLLAPCHELTTDDYNNMLHMACAHYHYNFAKWCLKNGADVNSEENLLYFVIEQMREKLINHLDED